MLHLLRKDGLARSRRTSQPYLRLDNRNQAYIAGTVKLAWEQYVDRCVVVMVTRDTLIRCNEQRYHYNAMVVADESLHGANEDKKSLCCYTQCVVPSD